MPAINSHLDGQRRHHRGRAPNALAATLLCLLAPACAVDPAPAYPRPALTRPASPVEAPELLELAHHDNGRTTGILVGSDQQVHFEIRRADPPPRGPEQVRPMVLLVPILAGGRELMGLIAQRLTGHGFDVAFCERAGRALTPPQRGPDLNELFRRTVLHQRLLLTWLRTTDTPPPSIHVLGLSMGGIISTVLAAVDPEVQSVAICLAGADLPSLILTTSESRVHHWLEWRQETDGIGIDSLHWELTQFLSYEPSRYAPFVPTEKVLFVSAMLDTVVPRHNQDVLGEGLGRPQRLDIPFGHYSAALAIDRVISAAADHFRAHCPRPGRYLGKSMN